MNLFCAATPVLVLLHKLLTGPLQKRKCFSEISRYPTYRFSAIVTWKSISKMAELKPALFANKDIRMWTFLQGC